uniref:Uncharacterized protein n=1 Tax=Heterorhabditis bacteriophora TaxID=37862 RepID=A0A1I7W6D5_HETBA
MQNYCCHYRNLYYRFWIFFHDFAFGNTKSSRTMQ